jgi:hypothetical protein
MARNDVVRYEDDTPATNVGATTTRTVIHRAVPPLLNFSKFWERYGEPPTKWLPEAFRDISELVCMPAGWDSYSAPSPRRDAGLFALEVLNRIMRPGTPSPQIVPSSSGGLQIEWHEKDIDLELHITAPYEMEFWFEDHRTNETLSTDLSEDLSQLARPILLLSSR